MGHFTWITNPSVFYSTSTAKTTDYNFLLPDWKKNPTKTLSSEQNFKPTINEFCEPGVFKWCGTPPSGGAVVFFILHIERLRLVDFGNHCCKVKVLFSFQGVFVSFCSMRREQTVDLSETKQGRAPWQRWARQQDPRQVCCIREGCSSRKDLKRCDVWALLKKHKQMDISLSIINAVVSDGDPIRIDYNAAHKRRITSGLKPEDVNSKSDRK